MRLLLEAEVESHGCFPLEEKGAVVHLGLPDKSAEFFLKNGVVEVGDPNPTMIASLVFQAEDFETGIKLGRELICEILDALTFTTCTKFSYGKSLRLIDWSEGTFERDYQAFQPFPGHDLPYQLLDPTLVGSAFVVWAAVRGTPTELALHWFASAISAGRVEDQFQLFWYSIEIIADIQRPTKKIPDLCVKCSEPLYCRKCDSHPTHRPFNYQAIRMVFEGIVDPEDREKVIDRAFKVRNMLLHGSTRKVIEKELDAGLEDVVDEVAFVARRAIFPHLENAARDLKLAPSIHFVEVDRFARGTLHLTVNLRSGKFEAEYSQLEKFPVPELSLVHDSNKNQHEP